MSGERRSMSSGGCGPLRSRRGARVHDDIGAVDGRDLEGPRRSSRCTDRHPPGVELDDRPVVDLLESLADEGGVAHDHDREAVGVWPLARLYDRVGGGDGFASGLAYGFLEGKGPQGAVEYGAAHGALAMTTPGDTSMVNVKEVEAVMKGKGARVIR